MYTYNAKVVDITDGDTVVVDIDLGFGVWLRKQVVQMAKINNSELNMAAKDFLKGSILNRKILIRTRKKSDDPCEQWSGTIFLQDRNSLININDKMITDGYVR